MTNFALLPRASERAVDRAGAAIAWDRPVLVGSCPSSGSTLLSVMLDAHPDMMCGPELSILAHPLVWQERGVAWRRRLIESLDAYPAYPEPELWNLACGAVPYVKTVVDVTHLAWYGLSRAGLKRLVFDCDTVDDLVRSLFGPALERRGKRIWAEKSPPNLYSMRLFLEHYPLGKAIVMVRDGRDVVCSLMKRGFTLFEAASIWLLETTISLQLGGHPRVKLVRYEDLVRSPVATLDELNEFLELPAAGEAQSRYYEQSDRVASDRSLRQATWTNLPTAAISSSAVGRWRRELAPVELELFYRHRLCDGLRLPAIDALPGLSSPELLAELGYEPPSGSPVPRGDMVNFLVEKRCFSRTAAGAAGLHRTSTELALEPEVLRQTLADSQTGLARVTADFDAATADLAVARQRVLDLEDSLLQVLGRAENAEASLHEIHSSRGWQMLQNYRALIARLPGRRKCAKDVDPGPRLASFTEELNP